ncbi:LacI family DNA-binding transcriptional regulator [Roseibium sp. Sym1]|uniref:LacI family DNA-binding transcriptional regulator n=1 Tax=Roseibium sp. Sym1 TaxID=3016006 RepID=UPI0022B56462|nr:LacI family DNA-binding transcriptional regulator [Roseibium sp. Sym1]
MADEGGTKTAKVTIRTVAKDAGVSVAAVSKVLRNAYGVSDGLREKVTASIEKLGYRPSTAARAMRGRTYSVGLLVVGIGNPFLPDLIDGISAVLSEDGYQTLIGVGRAQLSIESALIESMIDNKMDGLILVGPRLAGSLLEDFARQIPMVVIGHHEATADSFDTINSDDRLGAALAVKSVFDAGYSDLAMISPPARFGTEFDVFRKREEGYEETMAELGHADQVRIFRCREGAEFVDADLSAFLDTPDRPEAVFCWSDLHAVPLLDLARSRGVKIPEELAIIGYDNSPVAALSAIGLASIEQHPGALGRLAATTLLERISGRKVSKHQMLEPRVVMRSSLG